MPASVSFFDLVTGASTLLTNSSTGLFALPTNATLLHASATMHTASDSPIRVSLALQYDNVTAKRGPIGNGPRWLRSTSSFGVQDAVRWDGEIDFGSQRASLLVLARNDTGATETIRVTWVWRRRR